MFIEMAVPARLQQNWRLAVRANRRRSPVRFDSRLVPDLEELDG